MRLSGKTVLWCALFAFSTSCGRSPAPVAQVVHAADAGPRPATRHEVHLTGTIQAVHFFTVATPQIGGQDGRVPLTRIIASGMRVKTGDLLAEFDPTKEQAARSEEHTSELQ